MSLCLCGWAPQDAVPDLLKKLNSDDAKESEAAAEALVKKGAAARSAVDKALAKAGSDRRERYEDVLLRIDAGTDASTATIGSLEVGVHDASVTSELGQDGKPGLRLKLVFQGNTIGEKAEVLTLAKGTLITPKGKIGLLTKGAKGEAFNRTFDPMTPKAFEYGAILPPRHPVGTRAVIVFDLEGEAVVDGRKQKVAKTVRTPIFVISKKE